MTFSQSPIAGAYVIDLDPVHDERGFFARAFCEREFERHGLATRFPQCNISFNRRRYTLSPIGRRSSCAAREAPSST